MEQTTPSLQIALHGHRAPTRVLREALDRVGARFGLTDQEIFDLKVAATEALTNAIKGSSNGRAVKVEVERREDSVEIVVTNDGAFEFNNPALFDIESEGGRGIPLMFALVDEVEFSSTRDGTRVRMCKRVGGGFRPRLVAGFG